MVCGSAAGRALTGGFRVWCQGMLTHTAVLHHLIMLGLCAAREEGGWKTAQAEETNDKL